MEFRANSLKIPHAKRRPTPKLRYVERGLDLNSILPPFPSTQRWIENLIEVTPRRVLRSHSRGRETERGRQPITSSATRDSTLLRKRRRLSSISEESPPATRHSRGRSPKRSRGAHTLSACSHPNSTQRLAPATKRRCASPSPESTSRRVLRSASRARLARVQHDITVRSDNTSYRQTTDMEQSQLQAPVLLNHGENNATASISSYVDMTVARRLQPAVATIIVPFCDEKCDKSSDTSDEEEEMGIAVDPSTNDSGASAAPNCCAIITGTESSSEPILTPTSTDEEVYHETSSDDPSEASSLEDEKDCPRSQKSSWGSMCGIV